jgi:hypothetical protein
MEGNTLGLLRGFEQGRRERVLLIWAISATLDRLLVRQAMSLDLHFGEMELQ